MPGKGTYAVVNKAVRGDKKLAPFVNTVAAQGKTIRGRKTVADQKVNKQIRGK